MGFFDFFKRQKQTTVKRNYAASRGGRLFGDFIGGILDVGLSSSTEGWIISKNVVPL